MELLGRRHVGAGSRQVRELGAHALLSRPPEIDARRGPVAFVVRAPGGRPDRILQTAKPRDAGERHLPEARDADPQSVPDGPFQGRGELVLLQAQVRGRIGEIGDLVEGVRELGAETLAQPRAHRHHHVGGGDAARVLHRREPRDLVALEKARLQRIVVESGGEADRSFPGLARRQAAPQRVDVVAGRAGVLVVEPAPQRLVQIGARPAALSQPVGGRARHDEAPAVRRIELGRPVEMLAGLREASVVVIGEPFAVLGGGPLDAARADVGGKVGDQVGLAGLRGGPGAAGDLASPFRGSAVERGVRRVDQRKGGDRRIDLCRFQVVGFRVREPAQLVETGGAVVVEESGRGRIGSVLRPVERVERLFGAAGAEPRESGEVESGALAGRLGGRGGERVGPLVVALRERRLGCRKVRGHHGRGEREGRDHRWVRSAGSGAGARGPAPDPRWASLRLSSCSRSRP